MTRSVPLATIGLFLVGFRPGDPAEPCEPGDLMGEDAFEELGIEMGPIRAFGFTLEPWSIDSRWWL